jgi:hypothetical protein
MTDHGITMITKGFILAKENTLIGAKILRDHASMPFSRSRKDPPNRARLGGSAKDR